jgi:hypothetical protein
MQINPQIIHELRSMFQDGATPSRLIEHLATYHDPSENWFHFVQTYFRKAFSVGIVPIPDERDRIDFADLNLAHLNKDLVHEMVRTKPLWNIDPKAPATELFSWLGAVSATADPEPNDPSQDLPPPQLAQSWSKLDSNAQAFVRRRLANADAYYERVLILARLTERLQQKVTELEKRLAETDLESAGTGQLHPDSQEGE